MPAALAKLRVTQKLLITVTLIVAGFLLFNLLISRYVLGNHALQAADELAFSILDRTDRQIVQVFSDFEKLIKGMAGTRAVRNLELDDMQDLFLPQVLVRQPYLNGIYLGTADGSMHGWGHGAGYIDTRPILPPGYDPRERPWYKLAALAGGFAVTEPYRYANVDVMGITCVLPLYDEDHQLVAVLGMDIWVDSLVNILEDFDLPMNAKVAILDGNGNIIASQLNGELDFSREVTAIDFSQHTSPPVVYEGAFLSGYAGESYRIIYRKLDSYKLTVVAAIPYDSILSETRGLVQIVSLLYLILIMSMVLVVSAITGRIVVAPLNYMVSVVDRKKNGELGARILLRNRDEFGILAAELNELLDTVDAHADQLEEKVRERTIELSRLQQENTLLRVAEERKRIYQDMHDSIGAKLTNIFFCNSVFRARMADGSELPIELLDSIEENCLQAVQSLKAIVYGLKESGCVARDSLQILIQSIRKRLETAGIALDSKVSGRRIYYEVPQSVQEELTKVFEEMVTNVLKHSQASLVIFRVRANADGVRIYFADDGIGFRNKRRRSTVHGLNTIRERIKKLGGILRYYSKGGTKYQIFIPGRVLHETS